MNEGNESFTTRKTRTVLMDSKVGEGVGVEINVGFYFAFLYARYKNIFRVEKGK